MPMAMAGVRDQPSSTPRRISATRSPDAHGIELSATQFHMILDGIDITQPKRFRRYSRPKSGTE